MQIILAVYALLMFTCYMMGFVWSGSDRKAIIVFVCFHTSAIAVK